MSANFTCCLDAFVENLSSLFVINYSQQFAPSMPQKHEWLSNVELLKSLASFS
jgi:hypothetical protein